MYAKNCRKLQTYTDSLDSVSKQRYIDKLSIINNEDPYAIEKHRWSLDIKKWANVTYPDIVNFLIFTTSAYSLDQLKSYKSLDAYNQFVCGWVRDVAVWETEHICVHTAKVMHSQRMNDAPLTPWAIIQRDGKVLAAHCNCMAGLGESCTHIAAMLFSIEATVKIRESQSVTDVKSYWLPASVRGCDYAPIEEIDFTSAKSKKRKVDLQFSATPTPSQSSNSYVKHVDEPTENEVDEFLRQLSCTGAHSAILSIKSKYQEPFVPKVLSPCFPKPLSELFCANLIHSSFDDVIKYCQSVVISVSEEEAVCVESATKSQSQTKLWNHFRCGRITASRMYAACHSDPLKPSKSLITAICYPEAVKFSTAATLWGCSHEKKALQLYSSIMEKCHDNFCVDESGLVLHPDFPMFGASPDSSVYCDCCGHGVVEIKCPFCIRNCTISDGKNALDYLQDSPSGLKLKKKHAYFYQVQMQIHLCGAEYGDFVIWTEKDMHIERLEPDTEIWSEIVRKGKRFHAQAVMPELVSRFFSRSNMVFPLRDRNNTNNVKSTLYCICQKTKNETMVACDNENCLNQWFHLSCLNITEQMLPDGKWYCPSCQQLP